MKMPMTCPQETLCAIPFCLGSGSIEGGTPCAVHARGVNNHENRVALWLETKNLGTCSKDAQLVHVMVQVAEEYNKKVAETRALCLGHNENLSKQLSNGEISVDEALAKRSVPPRLIDVKKVEPQ